MLLTCLVWGYHLCCRPVPLAGSFVWQAWPRGWASDARGFLPCSGIGETELVAIAWGLPAPEWPWKDRGLASLFVLSVLATAVLSNFGGCSSDLGSRCWEQVLPS